MDHIAKMLNDYVLSARHDSSGVTVARFMLAHMEQLEQLRLIDIAEACYVSKPSVLRFVRALGFDGYAAFKVHLSSERQRMAHEPTGGEAFPLALEKPDYLEAASPWIETLTTSLSYALHTVDSTAARRMAQDILGHERVYCSGTDLSGLFGPYLSHHLARQHKGIVLTSASKEDFPPFGDPSQVLVILITQDGSLLSRPASVFHDLRDRCDRLWLVTHISPGSFNEDCFDDVLYLYDAREVTANSCILLTAAELVGQWCQRLVSQAGKPSA